MLTEKDYCDYETCVALSKAGFPQWELPYELFSQKYRLRLCDAHKWLREKGIFVHISLPLKVENDVFWNYEVLDEPWDDGKQNPCICASGGLFDSYEEALQKGIKAAVKLLKEESDENTETYKLG